MLDTQAVILFSVIVILVGVSVFFYFKWRAEKARKTEEIAELRSKTKQMENMLDTIATQSGLHYTKTSKSSKVDQ